MLVSATTVLVTLELLLQAKAQTFTLRDVPSLSSDPTLTQFTETLYNANNALDNFCDQFGFGDDVGYYDVPGDSSKPVHMACGDQTQFPKGATKCATPSAGSVAAVLYQTFNHGYLRPGTNIVSKLTCASQDCANDGCDQTPTLSYINSNACNAAQKEVLVLAADPLLGTFPDCGQPGFDGFAQNTAVPGPTNGNGVAAVITGTKVANSVETFVSCNAGFMPVGQSCLLAASQVPRRIKRGRFFKRNAPLPGY